MGVEVAARAGAGSDVAVTEYAAAGNVEMTAEQSACFFQSGELDLARLLHAPKPS